MPSEKNSETFGTDRVAQHRNGDIGIFMCKHCRQINFATIVRCMQKLTRNDISRESSRFKIHETDTL